MALQKLNVQQFVEVTDEKEIQTVREKNMALIEKTTKQYYEIDVAEAMTKLATCGQLIQLAYAASDGFPCQAKVVLLLSKYGTLVKNSYLASTKFVIASIGALRYHKVALKILAKSPEKATKFICKCSDLAGQMALVAADLSDQAAGLAKVAEEALVIAVADKSLSSDKKKEMEEMIKKAQADAIKFEAKAKGLADTLQEVRQQEAEAIKEAKAEAGRAFALNIIKSVVAPATQILSAMSGKGNSNAGGNDNDDDSKNNDDDNKGKTASDRAFALTKEKYNLQKQAIEENAKLAKTVAALRGFKESENTLEQALASIEIAIKTLGKIKVIFSNTRLFWEGVQANCNRLVTIGGDIALYAEDKDMIGEFIPEIQESMNESALNWFALSVVNYEAKKAIIQVDEKMDSIMNNLPDKSEALQLVDQLSGEMEQSLAIENEKLAASNEQIKAIEN